MSEPNNKTKLTDIAVQPDSASLKSAGNKRDIDQADASPLLAEPKTSKLARRKRFVAVEPSDEGPAVHITANGKRIDYRKHRLDKLISHFGQEAVTEAHEPVAAGGDLLTRHQAQHQKKLLSLAMADGKEDWFKLDVEHQAGDPLFLVSDLVLELATRRGNECARSIAGDIFKAMALLADIEAPYLSEPAAPEILGSLFAIAILAFLVWAHHMFVTGLNPFLGSVFVLLTLLIAVPSAIKVFNWLTTLWRGNIRFTPGALFSIGFVSLFISGGLTGIFLGNSTIDIHLHDTMFVVAHFHIVMGVASMFGMFAGIYHWFPKMYGRYLNSTLGYLHFWVTITGAYLIFWPMHYQGLAGIPRRYLDKSSWLSFNGFHDLDKMITVVSIIVFAVQLMFVFNFFYSIFKGRKVTTTNPCGANTLEWSTPINPGHGNWEGEIPEVYRWPYDYAKDGREFIPQTEPVGANESTH